MRELTDVLTALLFHDFLLSFMLTGCDGCIESGQNAEVLNFEQGTIILKLPNSNVLAIHTVTEVGEDGSNRVFYPLVPAYATTICKIQGQTLRKVIIWLDCPYVPRGTPYVALSKVENTRRSFFHGLRKSRAVSADRNVK